MFNHLIESNYCTPGVQSIHLHSWSLSNILLHVCTNSTEKSHAWYTCCLVVIVSWVFLKTDWHKTPNALEALLLRLHTTLVTPGMYVSELSYMLNTASINGY